MQLRSDLEISRFHNGEKDSLSAVRLRVRGSSDFLFTSSSIWETTGLSPDGCDIIQIAATRFRNGDVVSDDSFFSYCRPAQPISRFISDYTGITDRDVRHAPRPIEALELFSKFVGESVIMAHNGHRFDIKFLESTCTRHRVRMRTVESIDTISFSKELFGRTRGTGHSLDRVMQRLGLNSSKYRRHDARGDIQALADAVKIMLVAAGTRSAVQRHCPAGDLAAGRLTQKTKWIRSRLKSCCSIN